MTISNIIINWYKHNKRDLPWRHTQNPYLIWVSEIIMQQTRINQGLPYYYKFIETFPTVKDLALADEESILKIWQGLGYYSRARNMHFTAKLIIETYQEIFPNTFNELLKLKGIGTYTAAAIASFCFNEPVAAIDGNVNRVISRLFDVNEPVNKASGQKIISELSEEVIDKKNPGTFNQAMMDFGAMICTPQNPKCTECPLQNKCASLKNKSIADRPVKIKNQIIRKRYFAYFVISNGIYTYICKRKENDIWKGLFEFPMLELTSSKEFDTVLSSSFLMNLLNKTPYTIDDIKKSKAHKLSHQHIFACFYKIHINENAKLMGFEKIKLSELANKAFPKLLDNYLAGNLE